MAKLRQTDQQVGRRAGVSLARAQRLAGKTSTADSVAPRLYVGVGALAIVGLVGYGIYEGTQASAAPDSNLIASISTGTPADVTAPIAGAASSAPAYALVEGAEAVVSPTSAPVPDAPVAQPREIVAAVPGCVETIERKIDVIRSAAAGENDWNVQQENVTALVQATLDCSDAQLEIAGSLELLGTDLADLRIRWDREDWNLDLAMIDGADLPGEEAAADPEAKTIQFVIR